MFCLFQLSNIISTLQKKSTQYCTKSQKERCFSQGIAAPGLQGWGWLSPFEAGQHHAASSSKMFLTTQHSSLPFQIPSVWRTADVQQNQIISSLFRAFHLSPQKKYGKQFNWNVMRQSVTGWSVSSIFTMDQCSLSFSA